MEVILLANDNLVEVDEAKNEQTGAFLNAAAVTADLSDKDGDAIGSQISMAYVAASNGKYQGILESSVGPLAVGQRVRVQINGVEGGTNFGWDFLVEVKNREP